MGPGDHVLPAAKDFPRICRTNSPAATAALGARLADLLQGGEILLLHGDLGAGKTSLVQGICARLEVAEEVVSPTFTLVNSYTGRLKVHHLDFYRIGPGDDLDDIGVPDILDEIWDGEAVGLVEWPGPLRQRLAATGYLEMLVRPGPAPEAREWLLRGAPDVPAPWGDLFPVREAPPC